MVTEFGAVDLHGRSIRERAQALIHIAHPDFREDLMAVARARRMVYPDQVVVEEIGSEELEALHSETRTRDGHSVHVRPIQPTDEGLLQDLFYRSSDQTIYLRFFQNLKSLPHVRAQALIDVDYHDQLALVAVDHEKDREVVVAVGRYYLDPATGYADCAFMVRDDWQDRGIGRYLVTRLAGSSPIFS